MRTLRPADSHYGVPINHGFSSETVGPPIELLPAKLWLLGLRHLGQAYAWTIALLGCPTGQTVSLYLPDYDVSTPGNWSAGLLCEDGIVGEMKTRIASRCLEQRGFSTRIIERPFDENTRCRDGEPRVALCGFDNAEFRRLLEVAGYDLIVDAALGGDVNRFDRIVLRTFPDGSEKPLVQPLAPSRSLKCSKLFTVGRVVNFSASTCAIQASPLSRPC